MYMLARAASRENPLQIGDSYGDACRHCGSTLIIIAPPSLSTAKTVLLSAADWLRNSWLGKLIAACLLERRARLAIEELRSWDDHMLRDVGLERAQIEPAVRGLLKPVPRDDAVLAETRHPCG